ncbi:hypothetical protein BY458DRAFT_523553 [Sporodiniella umbellata]|nr:hypothetical protein BY458DRAFT_523553 [Sporodiniella umbellata]
MEKLPDFSKFKLDDFSLNRKASQASPAPHRLREARRSFVLYLEPTHESPLYISLRKFYEKTLSQFGPNQAHNTPPHASILQRIIIERNKSNDLSTKWKAVDILVSTIDKLLNTYKLHGPDFAGYQLLEKPSRSLVMNIKLPESYFEFANSAETELGSTCAELETNVLDKVHLAYNVLKSPPKAELKKIRDLAESSIDVYDWIKTGGSWNLVLHEVMIESQAVGIPHQLKQIRTWPIYQRPPQQFVDFLPVSVRIKLPWLNNSSKRHSHSSSSVDNNSSISRKTAASSNKEVHTF